MAYIGYMEGSAGIGLLTGPPIGSLLYGYCGYQFAFFAFGTLTLLTMFAQVRCLPDHLNATD